MKFSTKKRKILVIIIGLLFILSLNFSQKEVKGFFYSISSPIQKSFWSIGDKTSDFLGAIFEAEDLKKENEDLNLKIQALLAENISLKELKKENQALREALELGLEKEFRLEMAEVIGKDLNRDFILINKGLKDGISENLPVVTSQKVILGKTIDIYDKFSRVALISDKDSSFEAKGADSDIAGVVRGQGGSGILMDLIPKEKEIKEGDVVVSGSQIIYPQNFLVGLVKEVKRSDINPFQQAKISPFFDIADLEKVFIILNF